MDAQHFYEIHLKKDELLIHLSSDDVYFISKQMDKWFRILLDDSYVPVSLPQPSRTVEAPVVSVPEPEPVAQPEPVSTVPPVVEAPPPHPEPMISPVSEPAPMQAVEMPSAVETPPPVLAAEAVPLPEPQPPIPPAAPTLAPVLNVTEPSIPTEAVSPPVVSIMPGPTGIEDAIPQPVAELVAPALSAVVQEPAVASAPPDAFEAVMDTVMRDLESSEQMAPMGFSTDDEPVEIDPALMGSLSDLCEQAQPASAEDYLLVGAFYLAKVEGLSAFSLKRVNSNLVKSGYTPVNHSVLETLLSKGYLSMVPDLTGTAEVTEYVLTAEGAQRVTLLL